jgi:crossover junction endonuclease MUS81
MNMADTCANPLLLGWIKEWLDEARERNSKGVTVYVLWLTRLKGTG